MKLHGPTFIGIGASFAGWSELRPLLTSHPQIANTLPHLDYFSTKRWREKDATWYIAGLPPVERGVTVRGEVTMSYLTHPQAAERIVRTFPDTKLIVCLRHPLARAIAEYQYYQQLPNATAYQSCSAFMRANPAVFERGLYGAHLSRYFAYYSPLELHSVFYHELATRPLALLEGMYRWLGIDPFFVPKQLQAFVPPEDPPLHPSRLTRAKLALKARYKAWKLAKLPPWQPPEPDIRQWFTPEEEAYWVKAYWSDVVLLSDIHRMDLLAVWFPEYRE
jgi:hypothetical protein